MYLVCVNRHIESGQGDHIITCASLLVSEFIPTLKNPSVIKLVLESTVHFECWDKSEAWLYTSPVSSKNVFILICLGQGLNLDFWVLKPAEPTLLSLSVNHCLDAFLFMFSKDFS